MELYQVKIEPIKLIRLSNRHYKPILLKLMIGFVIIFIFANWVPELLSLKFNQSLFDYLPGKDKLTEDLIKQLPEIPLVSYLYSFIFTGVITLAETLFALTALRKREVEYIAILESFKLFAKALAIYIAKTIIVSFLFLCFIIPGILAIYNFRQAYFILADDPSKGVMQCLAESKLRMRGNRLNLFYLDISYLPYILAGCLPLTIMDTFINAKFTGLAGTLIPLILEIPIYLGYAIYFAGTTLYYELLIEGSLENLKYEGEEDLRELANRV